MEQRCPTSVIRFRLGSLSIATAAALTAATIVPTSVHAQGAGTGSSTPSAQPATPADSGPSPKRLPASGRAIESMVIAGAVTACRLAILEKVPISKAMQAAAVGIVNSIFSVNDGQIEGFGKVDANKLAPDIFSSIFVAIKPCYNELSDSDKKYIQDQVAAAQKQRANPANTQKQKDSAP